MAARRNWTRSETLRALELYLRTPFGRIHLRNPQIIALAAEIGRTPGSVGLKMANLAAIDPTLARKGMGNASAMDRAVWAEFFADPEAALAETPMPTGFAEQSAALLRPAAALPAEDAALPEGRDAPAFARARRGQARFRDWVMTSYEGRCAATGLDDPRLLTASHITPWAEDASQRMNPRNGLALNALHDRAFDRGLITWDRDWRVRISPGLGAEARGFFARPEYEILRLPERFAPDPEAMARHRARHAANF